MLNKVNFATPVYNNRVSFKASPEDIAKRAIEVDLEEPEDVQDFMNTLSKEKPETLRTASTKLNEQEAQHPFVEWLKGAADTLEKLKK